MIIDRLFHNIKRDACGRLIDDETWWDDKEALTGTVLDECGWIECEGRHYCDQCWEYDDDDNIVTKDGRKWSDCDHKEILSYRLDFLDDMDESLTLTQFRIKMVQASALYRSLVGSLYKNMLAQELEVAEEMFRRMIRERYRSEEHDRYLTFAAHGIFDRFRYEAEKRLYNHN